MLDPGFVLPASRVKSLVNTCENHHSSLQIHSIQRCAGPLRFIPPGDRNPSLWRLSLSSIAPRVGVHEPRLVETDGEALGAPWQRGGRAMASRGKHGPMFSRRVWRGLRTRFGHIPDWREGGREGKASELLESLGGCLFRVLTGLDRRRFDITS